MSRLLLLLLLTPYSLLLSPSPPARSPLHYGTFIGGALTEEGTALAVDDAGATYITGYTSSLIFPAASGPSTPRHGVDVYVAKVTPDGSALDYILWINPDPELPDDEDYATAIAIDGAGRAVVAGHTRSPVFCDFLNPAPGYDTSYNGNTDAFVFRVNAEGTALDYCTYLGGSDLDRGMALALDASGNAYLGGGTFSADFPTTVGGALAGARDLFVARIGPDGTTLDYATLIGGAGQEEIRALAVNPGGEVHASGWTRSADFPVTTGAFDTTFNGGADAFALHLSSDAQTINFASYFGGPEDDYAYTLALDAAGSLYVTGETGSATFPTTPGAFDTSHGGGTCDFLPCPDAFALHLNSGGNALLYATFLGDDRADLARGAALDGDGRLYLSGLTRSPAFPTTPGAFDTTPGGDADAFLSILAPDGATLAYSTFLGGGDTDDGYALAVHSNGEVALGGKSRSPAFPTTPTAFDNSHNGDYDIYVLRLQPFAAGPAVLFAPVIARP